VVTSQTEKVMVGEVSEILTEQPFHSVRLGNAVAADYEKW
jgi:hypothetical protein